MEKENGYGKTHLQFLYSIGEEGEGGGEEEIETFRSGETTQKTSKLSSEYRPKHPRRGILQISQNIIRLAKAAGEDPSDWNIWDPSSEVYLTSQIS